MQISFSVVSCLSICEYDDQDFGHDYEACSPKIFGPNEDEGLDIAASRNLLSQLTQEINSGKSGDLSIEQVAAGFLRIANEAMCRPIRT